MFIYRVHILMFPFALLVCAIDAWIVFAILCWAARRIFGDRCQYRHRILREIAETPAQFAAQRLAGWRGQAVSAWVPWTIVIGTALILRHLLVMLILSMSST